MDPADWKKGDVLRGEGALWLVGEPPDGLADYILIDRLVRFGDCSIGVTLGHCYPPEHGIWRRFEIIAYADALTTTSSLT